MITSPPPQIFFFHAEDGIRDTSVTGVQTCALPIYLIVPQLEHFKILQVAYRWRKLCNVIPVKAEEYKLRKAAYFIRQGIYIIVCQVEPLKFFKGCYRSEERRVGKECRCRLWEVEEK